MPENAKGFHWSTRLESLEFLFRADALATCDSEQLKAEVPDIEFTSGGGSGVEWRGKQNMRFVVALNLAFRACFAAA